MNPLWQSLLNIWKDLSGPQRLTLGGTTLLTVTVLAGFVWMSQKPELSLLFAGLDPAEAAKISDELRDQKLPYEISGGGRSIYVPRNKVYELRLQLAAKGIPKSGSGGGGVGFEIFDRPSFGLSDFLQKANYYRALQGEMERTIARIEEVESARVLIVVPNERLFAAEKTETKASVFLQLRASTQLPPKQVKAIRFLVANGVEGLKPNRVAIVDNTGTLLAENEEETSAGLSSSQVEVRKNVEGLYASKVQTMLDQVLGPGQSVVRVTADMNFDTVQQTEEKFDSVTPVARSESSTTEDIQTPVFASGGAVGTGSNLGVTNAVSVTQVSDKSTTKKDVKTTQYEIGKTVSNTLKGVGEIKKLSVAVFVHNKKFEGTGAERKEVDRTDQDISDLDAVIRSAVGFATEGKGKRNDEFTIKKVAFAMAKAPEGEVKTASTLTSPERIGTYLSWAGQGLLVVLAIGLFLYFRSMLGSARTEQLKTDLALDGMLSERGQGALRGGAGQAISVTELSKLIRENPTNMAQSLKNWLSQGS